MLYIGNNAGSSGTYNLISGGSLITNAYGIFIGASGNGEFDQSGGTVGGTNNGSIALGGNRGSSGTCNLTGGAMYSFDLDVGE